MDMDFKFDLQTFAETEVPVELRLKAWAKQTWESGFDGAFFNRFIGSDAGSIIQRKEELNKGDGMTINIPLLMPLKAAGVLGDDTLEDNEEQLIYKSFDVVINQVRNGVKLRGRFEEKKTQLRMRKDARNALTKWLSKYIDTAIYACLTGILPPYAPSAADFAFDLTPPSDDRVIYAGNATAESDITVADTFNTTLIGKAKRMAMADPDTMIQPVNIDGHETYVMVIDEWQARDLKRDPVWLEAQQYANVRGEKNPIFSGALGIYDGVVLHSYERAVRTETGANGAKVGHALFLGAQAAVFAEGEAPRWEEDTFDYGNKWGASIGRIFGIKKSQFKFDGTNDTDFGVINIITASTDD